ncbi:MAG TPA: right-handed parallel beta-helix repeat-containing protein, partial [Phycisphaerales bacterium]|nr:right-handed parallel beta-helix repeat-containing protein [Phycisphaerales bacterium]
MTARLKTDSNHSDEPIRPLGSLQQALDDGWRIPKPASYALLQRLGATARRLYLLTALWPVIFGLGMSSNAWAQTEVEGEVSGVWDTDGSPYILVGNATVPEDESLTIEPGVVVVFGEDLTLVVNGQISAVGTEEDTIRFRGPEGLVSGRLQINANDEDTLSFAYCRFDSMLHAIYAFEHTLIVENCRFVDNIYVRLEGGAAVFRDNDFFCQLEGLMFVVLREGDADLDSVAIEDNHAHKTLIQIINTTTAVAQGNISRNYRTPEMPRYSRISFVDCGRVEVFDNIDCTITLRNDGRRLDSAIIENNRLGGLSISANRDWATTISNNTIADLGVFNAFAEINNNDITEFGISGMAWIGRARLERNLLREGVVLEDTCFAELTNNTIIMPTYFQNDARAVRVYAGGDDYQSTVTMTNNIIVSFGGLPYAVGETVDNIDGGYNCFWGFEGTYEGREDNLEGDIVADPHFVGGHPYEYQLQANSPCIDAGDPDSPEDPDGTRADIGALFYDQENGMPPAIISR